MRRHIPISACCCRIFSIILSCRSSSTQFNQTKGGVKADMSSYHSTNSAVKFMPPPPPPSSHSSGKATSATASVSSPVADMNSPIRNVEEVISAFAEIFVAHNAHLRRGGFTSSSSASSVSAVTTASVNSVGYEVPFLPPVPLDFVETHFQSLLRRLLPNVSSTASHIPLVANDAATAGLVERNRGRLATRVQSSGVFAFGPSPSTRNEGGTMVLRIRPGVREVAVAIADFLASLEPNPSAGALRKAVPLAVVRQISLSPSTVVFIRNELGNDVRRLLLVYAHDTFALTRNGAMVRLLNVQIPLNESIPKSVPRQDASVESTLSQSRTQGETIATTSTTITTTCTSTNSSSQTTCTPSTPITMTEGVTETASPALNVVKGSAEGGSKLTSFVANEADTIVHMGRRFIAPAAVERYRLAQRIAPILDFIPRASAYPKQNPHAKTVEKRFQVEEEEDGFVDFAAVRARVVALHPHLAQSLALERSELVQRREGILLSALSSLGVEWRWGCRLQPSTATQASSSFKQQPSFIEMGYFFVRRAFKEGTEVLSSGTASAPISEVGLKGMEGTEWMEATLQRHPWWVQQKCFEEDKPAEVEETEKDSMSAGEKISKDLWESQAMDVLHMAVYETLLSSPTTPSPTPFTSNREDTLYQVGACADAAFVQHLMRYFSRREYENAHSVLLRASQGYVPTLLKHEVTDTIACVFYPYGQKQPQQCCAQQNEPFGSVRTENITIPRTVKSAEGVRSRKESRSVPVMSTKYMDAYFTDPSFAQLGSLFVRPRIQPDVPPLALLRLLPARLVLDVIVSLYTEQQRRAEEIGLDMDDDESDSGLIDTEEGHERDDEECNEDGYLTFALLRPALRPSIRVYIRDHLGESSLIPLLVACHPKYVCVRRVQAERTWTAIGLTRQGRRLARAMKDGKARVQLNSTVHGDKESEYRSQVTGCLFTDDIAQQLDAFYHVALNFW